MANAVGFQSYPAGPSPDPQAVGAILAAKRAAMHAAGADEEYGETPDMPDENEAGNGADALMGARSMADRASGLGQGSPSEGALTATGGDLTGTPGRTTPPPPVGRMPSQASSNPVTRPELETADGMYDPLQAHSSSATASALGDAMSRTTGGSSGIGKVQNPSPGAPFQRLQLQKMGLSPVEIDLLAHGGGVHGL